MNDFPPFASGPDVTWHGPGLCRCSSVVSLLFRGLTKPCLLVRFTALDCELLFFLGTLSVGEL